MTIIDVMKVSPASRVEGSVRVPGDKSISHRAALIAAIASGRTEIANFSTAADCVSTIECLRSLGVEIEQEGESVLVNGKGPSGLGRPEIPLYCGNSGTTIRLISGILAGQPFTSTLTGDPSLSARPMGRIIEPLSAMGAEISSLGGKPPLTICGTDLRGIAYEMPVASAQVKSCILLAGLFAKGNTSVIERTRTRDHTERMLRWFGSDITSGDGDGGQNVISVKGGESLRCRPLTVPGDISSAAYFMAAAACLPGSKLTLECVGINPTRTAVIDLLRRCGLAVELSPIEIEGPEPAADLLINSKTPALDAGPVIVRGSATASLIDEVPVLAVVGTQLPVGIEFRDAGELRIKETDRISAMVEGLTRMGADVTEFDDGFRVGPSRLNGASVRSFGDHRVAMALAIAGLAAEGETEITDADVVEISFKGFFESLAAVVR